MKLNWTKGLSGDAKKDVVQEYASSSNLRKRLEVLLQEKQSSSQKAIISKDAYDSPNWAFKQADAVGYQRALEEVISLLK